MGLLSLNELWKWFAVSAFAQNIGHHFFIKRFPSGLGNMTRCLTLRRLLKKHQREEYEQ